MSDTATNSTVQIINDKLRGINWRTIEEELAKVREDFKGEPEVLANIDKISNLLYNTPALLRLEHIVSLSTPSLWPLRHWNSLSSLDVEDIKRYRRFLGDEGFWELVDKIASAKEFMGWLDQVVMYI